LRQSAAKVSTLMPRLIAISAQLSESSRLDDQHGVAGANRLASAASTRRGRWRCTCRALVGLQHPLHACMAGMMDGHKLVGHEVHHRPVHGAQDAVGDVGGAGIVEELMAARLGVQGGVQGSLRACEKVADHRAPALGEASEACDAQPLAK
jgi:hypothetical protein